MSPVARAPSSDWSESRKDGVSAGAHRGTNRSGTGPPLRAGPTTIKGGRVVTPDGVFTADVHIDQGVITDIGVGKYLPTPAEVVDARGCFVLPGGVDPHCHLVASVADASRAAAVGGTTTALSFTLPYRDEPPQEALRRAHGAVNRDGSVIDLGFHASCFSPDLLEQEDVDLVASLGADAIKIYLAYAELGIMATGVGLFRAMNQSARVGLPVQVHCEDGEIIEALVEQALQQGSAGNLTFAAVRPPVTEELAVARVLAVASLTHVDCYLPHVSTTGAIDHIREIRARRNDRSAGPPDGSVTVEACLHHVLLSDDEYRGADGAAFLVAPPLRTASHVDAIRAAIIDGTIDALGSDHCQERTAADSRIAARGSMGYGIAGIGARVPLFLSWGLREGISIERLSYLLSTGPALAFGYAPRKGVLAVGSDGDVFVWDPEPEWTVQSDSFCDGTGTAPYAGRRIKGSIALCL